MAKDRPRAGHRLTVADQKVAADIAYWNQRSKDGDWPRGGVKLQIRDGRVINVARAEDLMLASRSHVFPVGPVFRRPTQHSFEAWMFFLPLILREAFFREWLEERNAHRAAGRSEWFIWATLATQLLTMFIIGGKDRMLALIRKLWSPAHE